MSNGNSSTNSLSQFPHNFINWNESEVANWLEKIGLKTLQPQFSNLNKTYGKLMEKF